MNKIFALSIGLLLVVFGVCFVVAEEDADIEIVGLGDNCGDKSVCDHNSHLTCHNNRCRCDWANGFILDEHQLECVPGEESAEYDSSDDQEDDENSSDNESETKWPEDESKWETSENGTEYGVLKTISDESSYEYSSEDDQETPEKPKKPEPKSVLVVENEDEKDDDDKTGETELSENEKPKEAKTVAQPEVPSDKTEKKVWDDDDDDDDAWDWNNDSVEDVGPLEGVAKTKDVQCLGNDDCEKSTWGQHSSCDQGFCKCMDKNQLEIMRKIVEVNGTCYLWKEMESECETHEECDMVIKGPAWCHQEQTTGSRFCTCQPFHVWNEESRECLPYGIQGINSPCVNDGQCSAKEALGPFGRCSEVTGTCQCFSPLGVDSKKIFLFQDKCWEERNLLEYCETDQECEASLGSSAFCSPEQVCSCRPGHFCSQMLVRPTMSGFTMLVLFAIVMSFAISAIVCLVIRRSGGKSYVFVQQQNEV